MSAKLVKIPFGDQAPEEDAEALEFMLQVYPQLVMIAREKSIYSALNGSLSAAATLALAADEENLSQVARKAFVLMCRQAASAMEALLTSETN